MPSRLARPPPTHAARPTKRRRRTDPGAKAAAKAADDDGDAAPAWERPRQFGKAAGPTRRASLPVISASGAVKREKAGPPSIAVVQKRGAGAAAPAARRQSLPAAAPTHTRARLESLQTRLDALEASKLRIAALASAVLSDPRAHLPKLTELHALASRPGGGRAAALAILSQARLFADVAPGYRIRAVSAQEAEVKVSKDVAKLRAFESGLLAAYTRFVRFCSATVRRGRSAPAPATNKNGQVPDSKAVALAAARSAAAHALCILLQALPHFNAADAIAPAVCAVAADRDEALRAAARDALTAVLCEAPRASGPALRTCVLVARELCGLAERSARAVSEEAVRPLVAIPFHKFALLPQSKKARNAPKGGKRFNRNKRRRRELEQAAKKGAADEKAVERDAAEKELERDLREAEAGQTAGELYAARKSLLDSVCRAYFNIIKSASADTEAARARRQKLMEQTGKQTAAERSRRPPPALAAALEGLLRVAAYVPPGVLDATLAALTPLLEGARLPTPTRLRSIAAAYAIVGANARAAAADAASFTADCHALDSALYACLSALFPTPVPVAVEEALAWDAVSAVQAATAFRAVPAVRASALGRRLAIAAAGAPGHASALALLRAAALVLPGRLVSSVFMQREADGKHELQPLAPGDGEGVQRCDLVSNDADSCGAERSAAWELAALQTHFHPAVRAAAADCALGLCGDRFPRAQRDIVAFAKGYSAVHGGLNPPPVERLVRPVRRKRRASEIASGLEGAENGGEAGCGDFFARAFSEQAAA